MFYFVLKQREWGQVNLLQHLVINSITENSLSERGKLSLSPQNNFQWTFRFYDRSELSISNHLDFHFRELNYFSWTKCELEEEKNLRLSFLALPVGFRPVQYVKYFLVKDQNQCATEGSEDVGHYAPEETVDAVVLVDVKDAAEEVLMLAQVLRATGIQHQSSSYSVQWIRSYSWYHRSNLQS